MVGTGELFSSVWSAIAFVASFKLEFEFMNSSRVSVGSSGKTSDNGISVLQPGWFD